MNSRQEEIGRYKEVKPEMIADASRLIKKGKVYDLAMEVNRKLTIGDPPQKDVFPNYNLITYLAAEKNRERTDTGEITWQTELIMGGPHNATHIDALCHIQYNGKIFNKYNVEETSTNFGMKKCGAETIKPLISRGILIDVAGYLDVEKLDDRHKITVDELKGALEKEEVKVRPGDTVIFRTGKITDFKKSSYMNAGPGIGLKAAIWLYECGMCVLGSDYTCIEVMPIDNKECVHKEMLYERGVYLMENLYLEELAREKVYEFFFICLPVKFTGSTGSWIRPVAMI